MDPDPHAIDDYIRENRARYADQAIYEQLIAAGHERAAINEAFGRAGPRRPDFGDRASERLGKTSGLVWLASALFVIGGIGGLAGFAMAASFGSAAGGALPLFLITYLVIGIGLIALLRWAIPRFGIRGGWATLVGLVLFPIFGALMFGTCVGAFNMARGG